jgi:hypothetical protein
LRNSFAGSRLSAKGLNPTLAQLRSKTGFAQMLFDEAGFLANDFGIVGKQRTPGKIERLGLPGQCDQREVVSQGAF